MMNTSALRSRASMIAAALVLAACSESTGSKSGPAAAFTAVSPALAYGVVSTALAQPIEVKVADTAGIGVQNATVTWTISGPATLSAGQSKTDGNGHAKVMLTFGASVGTSVIVASTTGLSTTLEFDATGASPAVRDDWTTYGHDAGRTGASIGAVNGPITQAWRYSPAPPTVARPLEYVNTAVAAIDAVYLQWSAQSKGGAGYIGATMVDRISNAGGRVWMFDGGYDANFGNWVTIWNSRLVYQDDGIGMLSLATGTRLWGSGVDWWGETLPDSSGLYTDQNQHYDGPGPFIAKMDATGKKAWTANSYGTVRGDAFDYVGGLAMAGGKLFVAGDYWAATTVTNPPAPGVYAFAISNGAKTAFAATKPTSKPSADGTKVYLVENGTALVARAQSDLHVVWTVAVSSPSQQAPVIANGMVIIAANQTVEAHDAATGALKWRSGTIYGLQSSIGWGGGPSSTLAAALGSGTLVATSSNDGIHVLSLIHGKELYHLAVSGSSLRNPVLVNDPARGTILYALDYTGLVAYTVTANP